ncbi:hypothetical protein ACM7F7_03775 [Pseudomonas aeruginosa]
MMLPRRTTSIEHGIHLHNQVQQVRATLSAHHIATACDHLGNEHYLGLIAKIEGVPAQTGELQFGLYEMQRKKD